MLRHAPRFLTRATGAAMRTQRPFATNAPVETFVDSKFVEAGRSVTPTIEPPKTPSAFMKPRPPTPSSTPSELTINFVLPQKVADPESAAEADEDVISHVDEEIENANVGLFQVNEHELLKSFAIEDNITENEIKLTRNYKDESVVVEVYMPVLVGEDGEQDWTSKMPMVIRIFKKNGSYLEIGCDAYQDEICIERLLLNPALEEEDQVDFDYMAMNDNTKKVFKDYLGRRGINAGLTNLLHAYMIDKDARQHLLRLQKVKGFLLA